MPNKSKSPTLLLCQGKDCFKKQRRAFDSLLDSATDRGLCVKMVKCQGSCAGPTAVVETEAGMVWFEKLQSSKLQSDVVALASGSAKKPTKRLSRNEITGKRKARAARKLGV